MATKRKTTQQMNQELQEKFPFLEIISEYTGANNKVTIRCNDCKFTWEAIPRAVLNSKCGCKNCKLASKKLDTSLRKFLEKFDSTRFKLVTFNNYTDVTVKCKKCGCIRNTTANNIYRYGCPKCGIERGHEALRLTKEEFIQRAEILHGDKYDYSKVNYINYSTPVIIICSEHGEFAQMPSKHLSGHGCPSCANRNMTTEKFIQRAQAIHNNKYDYSKVVYTKAKEKVCIICPEHGEFWQEAESHLQGVGCPKCNSSKGEQSVEKILKSLNIQYISQYTINSESFSNRKFMKVDFYLPDYNSIIEYNGIQHYVPVEKFGGEVVLKEQLLRDQELRNYCEEKKINLLEIKFNDSNIEKTIKDFLNNKCRVIK